MRNGIAKPSKSQALNKEQKIKRCRSENSAPLLLSHFTNSPRKERQRFCSNRTCEQNVGDGALDVPFGECQGFALSQFCVDVPCCKCYAVKHFETIRRMLCG